MPFTFRRLEFAEVVLIEATAIADLRGLFMETYRRSTFITNGIPDAFVQDNYSHSSCRGVLRGLHYQQNPGAQGKLTSVIRGAIFDVAVDIRKGSPTYGKWVSAQLSSEKQNALWVPPGFAHGFCVLSDGADVLYKCTEEYAPDLDRAIRWDDPSIGVRWPIEHVIVSPKDAAAPRLHGADVNYVYEGAHV